VTAVFIAALLAMSPTPPPESPRVTEGRWGGVGIALEVTASDARIELDCAHGTIEGPLVLDGDGGFDRPGLFVRERPGPVHMGGENVEKGVPVRYVGRVQGETLTLRIVRPNAPRPPSPLSAELGRTPRLRMCALSRNRIAAGKKHKWKSGGASSSGESSRCLSPISSG
jgi:hypothetical protein